MRIGSVETVSPLVLAPMAGITDRHFRLMLRRLGGVGIVTMEFVSSELVVRQHRRTLTKMRFDGAESPLSIQIYGSEPRRMAEAARVVQGIGADLCDINMGCPANAVLKGCAGCALMGDLDLARRIVREVRSALTIPLTVKFRAGLRDDALADQELGRICEGEGVDAVTLHPRTARQRFTGTADRRRIAGLAADLSIPVIGNGDVGSAPDAVRMMRETGCAGVMIGRASMTNPWIYRQTADLLAGRPAFEPTSSDWSDLVLGHFRAVVDEEDPATALHKLRTFTGWYARALPGGDAIRRRINDLPDATTFLREIEAFFGSVPHAA